MLCHLDMQTWSAMPYLMQADTVMSSFMLESKSCQHESYRLDLKSGLERIFIFHARVEVVPAWTHHGVLIWSSRLTLREHLSTDSDLVQRMRVSKLVSISESVGRFLYRSTLIFGNLKQQELQGFELREHRS